MPNMTKRSGSNRSYADRKAKGRPICTFTLSAAANADISELAGSMGISRSALVELAVSELKKRKKNI